MCLVVLLTLQSGEVDSMEFSAADFPIHLDPVLMCVWCGSRLSQTGH